MKIWNWLKSLSWVAVAGGIASAILLVLTSAKAARLNKRAENAESIAENILQDKTKKNIEKAAALRKKAEADKAKAVEVTEAAKKRLDELGAKDDTMADIADRFNKRKLRIPTD